MKTLIKIHILLKMLLFSVCVLICIPFIKYFMAFDFAMSIIGVYEGYIYELYRKGCISEKEKTRIINRMHNGK